MSETDFLNAIEATLADPARADGEMGRRAQTVLRCAGWLDEGHARRGYLVGMDLGGTKLLAALATPDGSIVAEWEAATKDYPNGPLGQVDDMVAKLLAKGGVTLDQVAQIVIGVPGVVARDGSVSLSPHVDFPAGQSFSATLEDALGVPVAVDNDVNVAAFGEYASRRADGLHTLAFAALGTGIGMGLVVDGQVLRGVHGAAGELGVIPFGADPAAAYAANPGGAFEATVSTRGILARYRAAGGKAESVRAIFDAAEAGDRFAADVVDQSLRDLAIGLATVVALIDPGLIVLGGGIGARPVVAAKVESWLWRLVPTQCRVLPSQHGARAGLFGALAKARKLAIAGVARREVELLRGAAA